MEAGNLSAQTSRPWGERVREWRTQRLLTLDQLATLLKVSRSTLTKWENGSVVPKDESLYVASFRKLQTETGEQPGLDDQMRVAALWRNRMRGTK